MKIFLALLCCLVPAICAADDWTPPKNADPSTILDEARDDAAAAKYKVALAKQLWYHENALRIEPAQSGVRLSFALSSWLELGEKYPPALAKMREVRDQTEVKIRDKDRVRVQFSDFHDFVSLNSTLRQNERSVKLFKWLHEDDAEDAQRIYLIAEEALVKAEEFEICGEYIDADRSVEQIGSSYEHGLTLRARFGEQHQRFVDKKFVNECAILVGILVKVKREEEAGAAAASFKKLVKDKDLKVKLNRELESALKGILPTPWP